MEKKVFMPSMEELCVMEEYCNYERNKSGGNAIYKYLLAKAIETLVITGKRNPDKGILKSAYKYLSENPYLAHAICKMYPMETLYSEIAQNDLDLCLNLLNGNSKGEIYNLDNLALFDDNVTSHFSVRSNVILSLAEYLYLNPEYRFEYKEGVNLPNGDYRENKLLEEIFSGNFRFSYEPADSRSELIRKLCEIEPYYHMLLVGSYQRHDDLSLLESINTYAKRYDITGSVIPETDDILSNPNIEVKRLLRCINDKKRNLY